MQPAELRAVEKRSTSGCINREGRRSFWGDLMSLCAIDFGDFYYLHAGQIQRINAAFSVRPRRRVDRIILVCLLRCMGPNGTSRQLAQCSDHGPGMTQRRNFAAGVVSARSEYDMVLFRAEVETERGIGGRFSQEDL